MVQATENVQRLWARYKATHRKELRDRLILKYLPLVKYISDRIFSRLPRRVDVRDLMSAGTFGLINAIEGFDLARGIKFETYCSVRVRGSIIDELRAQDWVPRPVRTRTQKLKEAKAELDNELGRAATDQEIAKRMGIEPAEVRTLGRETAATMFVSLSGSGSGDEESNSRQRLDILADSEETDPVEQLQKADFAEMVRRNLDEKETRVLLLYYYENLTMREIGDFLNLSESRVCQIHARIMEKLKEELGSIEAELVA